MPIARMDHFTILTTNAEKTVAFYSDILGFTSGPRPAFSFPGAWLYNDGKAVLHVVQRPSIPEGGGVLDHIAFWGTDPSAYVAKLKARGIKYDLRRLPENGHAAGLWQLFFFDPSGARVEIDFAASETVEGQGSTICFEGSHPHSEAPGSAGLEECSSWPTRPQQLERPSRRAFSAPQDEAGDGA
jgi:catechol 2,3-dioxygenase-like lactoylglutathione lyase family enzyme